MSAETPDTLKKEFQPYLDELSEEVAKGKSVVKGSPDVFVARAEKFKTDADLLFPATYLGSYRQSFLYYSSAASYEAVADCLDDDAKRIQYYTMAGRIYHFSGHGFRGLEEYRRSGIAYNKSGRCYVEAVGLLQKHGRPKSEVQELMSDAIRSYRRAKGVWSDVGDYDMAGKAYFNEQRTLQRKLTSESWPKGFAFGFWGIVTGYGESIQNWGITFILSVFAFGFANWATGLDLAQALNLSVQRSFLVASPSGNEGLLLLQIAYSYFILGLGLTILIRRFGPR
ncbi:MAG: hypothetical protein JRM73_00120 [Nitrososphaerota archaeon]|nr:hypothetical protein [Nitrososphaerota archaeon]